MEFPKIWHFTCHNWVKYWPRTKNNTNNREYSTRAICWSFPLSSTTLRLETPRGGRTPLSDRRWRNTVSGRGLNNDFLLSKFTFFVRRRTVPLKLFVIGPWYGSGVDPFCFSLFKQSSFFNLGCGFQDKCLLIALKTCISSFDVFSFSIVTVKSHLCLRRRNRSVSGQLPYCYNFSFKI